MLRRWLPLYLAVATATTFGRFFLLNADPNQRTWETTAQSPSSSEGTTGINTTVELYKNLSCPFEWTKYSCFHQGRMDLAQNGYAHLEHSQRPTRPYYWQLPFFQSSNGPSKSDSERSKLLLVGDSTVRQVFIALGCFFWQQDLVEDYFVDWSNSTKGWPCHNTPNCIENGNHSGFNVGKMKLKHDGPEIFFVPHGGTQRRSQPTIVQDRWIPEWNAKQQLTFHLRLDHDDTTYVLNDKDIVLYNIGLHLNPDQRRDMYGYLNQLAHAVATTTNKPTPTLVYLTTVAQHFQTEDGMYESERIHAPATEMSPNGCRKSIPVNPRRQEEIQEFQDSDFDLLIHVEDESKGQYHIGGGDCTHHCMPGVPDVTAGYLLDELAKHFQAKDT